MKKIMSSVLLIISLVFSAASHAETVWTALNSVPNREFANATACADCVVLYDLGNYTLNCIGNAEDKVLSVPSVTEVSNQDDTSMYNSVLTIASDGKIIYTVELTVRDRNDIREFVGSHLYEVNFQEGERTLIAELNLQDTFYDNGSNEECPNCLDALMVDGQLLLLFDNPDEKSGSDISFSETSRSLFVYDTETSRHQVYSLDNCTDILSYKDGIVLAALDLGGLCKIVQINLETLQENELEQLPEGVQPDAMTFSHTEEASVLYYVCDNDVYGYKHAETPKLIGRIPFFDTLGIEMIDSQNLLAYSADRVVKFPIQWDYKGASQQLCVDADESLAEAFSAEHPEIAVTIYQSSNTDMTDILMTRTSQPDVFVLVSNEDSFKQFRDRGYLLSLDSSTLNSYVQSLHPDIASSAYNEDRLCAIPISMTPRGMFGVNADLWDTEKFGALPQTWEEFLNFLEKWQTLCADYPEIQVMDNVDDAEMMHGLLLERLISEYDSWRYDRGNGIGYDTELFRSLAAKLNQLNFDVLYANAENKGTNYLFSPRYIPSVENQATMTALPLKLSSENTFYLNCNITYLAVNPYSDNPDLAIAFLEYCLGQIDAAEKIEMIPTNNEPIRWDDYEESKAALNEAISDIQSQLELCEEPLERPVLQENLQQYQQNLVDIDNSWRVRSEDVSVFRELSKRISVQYKKEISEEERMNVSQIRLNFIQGNLSVDEFVEQMDRKILMQEMENG